MHKNKCFEIRSEETQVVAAGSWHFKALKEYFLYHGEYKKFSYGLCKLKMFPSTDSPLITAAHAQLPTFSSNVSRALTVELVCRVSRSELAPHNAGHRQ
jgi:hypothetical protein